MLESKEIQQTFRSLLEKGRKDFFIPSYQTVARDEELVGLLVSKFFEQDGISILRALEEALVDANFHTQATKVRGLRFEMLRELREAK